MIKFKTFFGRTTNRADETANIWLSRNPNIKIIQMQYQQSRYGDHSICIMYEDISEEFESLQQEQVDMAIAMMRKFSTSDNEKE